MVKLLCCGARRLVGRFNIMLHQVVVFSDFILDMLVHFELYLVKTLAIHAADVGLRDECLGVDAFYDAEDGDRLDFAAHYHKNFDILLGIPPHSGQYRASAFRMIVDGSRDAFPFMREDCELHRLTVSVNHHVDHVGYKQQYHKSVNHTVKLVEQEIGGGDNAEINI